MSTRDLLAALLPAPAYDPTQANLNAWLTAKAISLDAVRDAGSTTLAALLLDDPALLSDFERILGLSAGRLPDADRMTAVKAALVRTGGLSRAYFIRLAAALGYEITISEPEPVPLGRLRLGQRLTSIERWWFWEVVIRSGKQYATCVSACNAPLFTYETTSAPALEALINELKPAHTFVRFSYGA